MRKDNIEKRQRVDLRPVSMALMHQSCPPGDIPNADHLEAGIVKLQSENIVLEGVNKELKFQLDRLDTRYEQFMAQHRLSTRNEVMMLGQIVRELHVFRQILIVSSAASNEEAERLMDKALPIIMELRGTLLAWRAREGIEVPEYDHGKEAQLLERLIQNPAVQKVADKEMDDLAQSRETEKER
ncbi:hypothetical protein [Phaeovulum sp. W22_SRMD_FR3]|uniref:hypothetical protein n=1 Tax=Phaeovulum sp. W22_SRMD_FR3 TaxID=3240274 RepID=UPI003F952B43